MSQELYIDYISFLVQFLFFFSGVNDYLSYFPSLHNLFESVAKSSYTFLWSYKLRTGTIIHMVIWAKLSDYLLVFLCCLILLGFEAFSP